MKTNEPKVSTKPKKGRFIVFTTEILKLDATVKTS